MKHLQYHPQGAGAFQELENLGLQHMYTLEEEGGELIGGFAPGPLNAQLSVLHAVLEAECDWNAQWEMFAKRYDGAHLTVHGHKIRLDPGPGFGDLSHPTTELMTELMCTHVPGRDVIDIGCGSGILSILATKLGARSVQAAEIDPEAIAHARHNFALNDLDIPILTGPIAPPKNALLLINMTRGEQEFLYQESALLDCSAIVSGLQVGQRPFQRIESVQTTLFKENWAAFIII